MNRLYREVPPLIQMVLLTSEGWLVGSSITSLLNKENVNDYDVIVPSRELFQIICKNLQTAAISMEINSFGGFKFKFENGLDLDIWPEELDHFLKSSLKVEYVFNMKRNILLKKEE